MGDQKNTLLNADVGARVTGQDIYEISDKARCALGTRLVLGDRVFRYCKNGSLALNPGYLVQAKPINATYDEDIVVPTTSAIGSKTVYITIHSSYGTTMALDELADGYVVVGVAGTGAKIGECYKIKSNTAAAAGATCTITLYDPLIEAVTAGQNTMAIVRSPYKDVVLGASTGAVIGVPIISVTAAYYFWAQTYGPVGGVAGGALVAGDPVMDNSNGTFLITTITTKKTFVGFAMTDIDSGDGGPIFLQIAP